MRELPRDLVTILRTEARNQRTPPIDYVIAEDGGRMVHTPEPDIAMAELLDEAATALAAERAAREKAEAQLADYERRIMSAIEARRRLHDSGANSAPPSPPQPRRTDHAE